MPGNEKSKELFHYYNGGITQYLTLFVALVLGMFSILNILSIKQPQGWWWALAGIYLAFSILGGLALIFRLKICVINSRNCMKELKLEIPQDRISKWFENYSFWFIIGGVWILISTIAFYAVYGMHG